MSKNNRAPRRLYECQECHARRLVHWVELNRAARPRCTGCGSARLELVSQEAREDQARLQAERVAGPALAGSFQLASQASKPNRKVT